MTVNTSVAFRKVDYPVIQLHISSIIEFSAEAFFAGHEVTKAAFDATAPRDRHEFTYLFKESVADMIEEIERQRGFFFIAENKLTKEIIGISMGRPYGKPALSQKFMETASKASSNFMDVMKDWWSLMEKYQVSGSDAPPYSVYHQAMTAVAPQFCRQGIGTKLSKVVMSSLLNNGFVALARENSSTASDGVMRHLRQDGVKVLDIDRVTNELIGTPITLRLQLVEEVSEKADQVASWFLKKREGNIVNLEGLSSLMAGKFSLFTNDKARELFDALEKLEILQKQSTDMSVKTKILQRITELEEIVSKTVNAVDHMGGMPIQGAAHVNDVSTLKKLIAKGADLNKCEPQFGGTILHVALHGGSEDAVREILAHAPHLARKTNFYSTTPLQYARELQLENPSEKKFQTIVQLIKDSLESPKSHQNLPDSR